MNAIHKNKNPQILTQSRNQPQPGPETDFILRLNSGGGDGPERHLPPELEASAELQFACDRIDLTDAHLGGGDDGDQPELQKKDRIKFTCPACGLNAWAKPSARLSYGTCNVPMRTSGANALPALNPVSGGNQDG